MKTVSKVLITILYIIITPIYTSNYSQKTQYSIADTKSKISKTTALIKENLKKLPSQSIPQRSFQRDIVRLLYFMIALTHVIPAFPILLCFIIIKNFWLGPLNLCLAIKNFLLMYSEVIVGAFNSIFFYQK
jgi:hypothetical protein